MIWQKEGRKNYPVGSLHIKGSDKRERSHMCITVSLVTSYILLWGGIIVIYLSIIYPTLSQLVQLPQGGLPSYISVQVEVEKALPLGLL